MKTFLICLISLLTHVFWGQKMEYTVIIKDTDTSLPIENATLIVTKTNQIFVSNKEGKVSFNLVGNSNIEVSEIMYETKNIRWIELVKNDYVIYIKNKSKELDEIVFSKEPPNKTLRKIITNSINKFTIPSRLKVYVREFFKFNDKYEYFNDGLVNFQFSKENKAIKTTLLVEQNRSYGLTQTDITQNLLGYNLNDIMEKYTSFSYLKPLLDPKILKHYEFLTKIPSSNKKYQIILATPLDSEKATFDEFEIIYEPEKKIIIQFIVRASPEKLSQLNEKSGESFKNYTKSSINISFKFDENQYFLTKAYEMIEFYTLKKDIKKNYQISNEFFTTFFEPKVFSYGEHNVFKDKTLFNKKNKILTNYWDVSGYTATKQEREVIQSLEGLD